MSDKVIRILLIEDNADDARVIRQMLADTTTADPVAPAFDLTHARRLSSGLKRLAEGEFDALLLALSLPDSQGLDTFVKAQAQAPQTPIIVLSDLDEKLALVAVQKGAQDYLVKDEASASMLVRAIRYATERKRLETMLDDSQAELAAIVENAPLVMLIVDQDVLVQKANYATIRFAGHSAEEIIGRRGGEALRCLHNLDDPRGCGFGPSCKTCTVRHTVMDTIEKGIRHTHVRAGLTVVNEKETKDLVLLISTAPLTVAKKPLVLLCIEDITERKQAERELQQSNDLLRAIIESAPTAIIGLDLDGNVHTVWNPAAEKMLGWSAQEAIGHPLPSVPTESQEEFKGFRERIRRGLTLDGVEVRRQRRDGSPIDYSIYASPLHDAEGQITGNVAVLVDITERKRVEEERARAQAALRESEELLRITLENILDPIFITDDVGEFTYICSNVPNALGYSVEEIRVMGNISLLIRDTLPSPQELRALGEIRGIEGIIETKSGDSRDFLISAKRVSIGDGTMLYSCHDITARKQAEEALRASEERFSKAFRLSPMGMAIFRAADGRFVDVNDVFTQISGYSREEIIGRTSLELQLYANPQERDSTLRTLREQGRLEKFEFRVRTKSGDIRDGLSATTEIDLGGEKHYLSLVLDITERKRAEEALRQSEERFRALYEDNPSMYFMVDAQGTVLSVNPFGADQLGYAVEELIGQSVLAVFYPDDRKAVQQQLMTRLEHPGQVAYWELRKVRQDGSILWVREAARAVQGPDGRPVVLIVCEDITERRRVEAEREHLLAQIREQARRAQEIMDTVPEGVLLLDANCRVLLDNPLGKRYLATLANAQVDDVLTRLGDRPLAELLTSPPKGLWHEVATTSRFFQAIARPIEDGPTPKGWVLVIRDVTQQRQVEQRIQQQERLAALGQLAAGIAHDFNNILAVISLYAGMSLRIADLPPLVYERLEVVKQQVRRASELVQQVLDFSRRAVLERGAMDLLTFLKEQINLLERMLPENIRVELVYGKDEYMVNADPTRMQQAVMNLATNARDAMPRGGCLSFGLERIYVQDHSSAPLPDMEAGDWVRVTITDTGTGIPSDVLPHIFEPFFTTKAAGRGTGLGLAQVYGIIKQHEGTIDVEAEIGAGTTFTLYLPALAVPQSQPSSSKIEQLVQGHGETVLVVEDDAVARQAVVNGLETLGYQVLQAANGLEALAIFEQHADKIELVLSDVVMPEMGGRSLLHVLHKHDSAVRVVLLTGYPLEEREFENLRALGLKGWVLKPLSIEQLAQVTAQALEDVEHK